MFNLGVYEIKKLEIDVKMCFVEHILDSMMKPVGYLCFLRAQYITGSVFSFCVTLLPKRLVYFVHSPINLSQLVLALQ